MDVPYFIVAHSVVGICIDIDGKLWFVNEAFAQIFGYSRHEFLGMEIAELVYFEDWQMIKDRRQNMLSGERSFLQYEANGPRPRYQEPEDKEVQVFTKTLA